MRQTARWLTYCLALIPFPGIALAQAPITPATPPAQTAPPNIARNCTPTQAIPQDGTIAPKGATTGQSAEPLGEKLADSNGVLCPPAGIDPDMHAPTPQGGSIQVIPPPGSPGGNPNVIPK